MVLNFIVKEYAFGWRVSLSLFIASGAFLALGMLLLPRSPRLAIAIIL